MTGDYNASMRIGLISDTHGRLDARVHDRLAGCDEILHAGDVGDPAILIELGAIAPVHAVRGNCDHGQLARLPEFVVRCHAGQTVLVTHILDRPARPSPEVCERLAASGAELAVYGHSHRPGQQTHDGVLFINPGSAGAPRFGLPPTVALLDLGIAPLCRIITLDGEELS